MCTCVRVRAWRVWYVCVCEKGVCVRICACVIVGVCALHVQTCAGALKSVYRQEGVVATCLAVPTSAKSCPTPQLPLTLIGSCMLSSWYSRMNAALAISSWPWAGGEQAAIYASYKLSPFIAVACSTGGLGWWLWVVRVEVGLAGKG